MRHLHTGLLLICLLMAQDSVSASFRAKPLPPNQHLLKFEFESGKVAVQLNLKHLQKLAERDADLAAEVFNNIELLPFARNPLLVSHLLESSAYLTMETIKNIPLMSKGLALKKAGLSQSEQDARWNEFYQQKELENLAWVVYSDVLSILLDNKKLLKLLAMTDSTSYDYRSMLEAKKESINRVWWDNNTPDQLRQRYAPELPSDRRLTKQEYKQFEQAIKAKLTELDASLAPRLLITSWEEMETLDWRVVSRTADTYSKALYYQAVVANILADGGADEYEGKAQASYVASDLVKFFYLQYSHHKDFSE